MVLKKKFEKVGCAEYRRIKVGLLGDIMHITIQDLVSFKSCCLLFGRQLFWSLARYEAI